MDKKIKGVNLGGWLVLEKWMTPQLFAQTAADDEYYLAYDLQEKEYRARLDTHRAEFITEADILKIAASGFNMIRIPVPYFIFGDRAPFIGCIEYLDKALNWAEAYGLNVLIDLHTAPFSQNGFDNGGLSGVLKWPQYEEEVEFELTVLERLAARYAQHPALWGIEVLNEPATEGEFFERMNPLERYPARNKELAKGSKGVSISFLQAYYQEAYTRMREYLPIDKVIAFHDGFRLDIWKDFFEQHNFENVYLDTHQYVMMAEMQQTEQNMNAYLIYLEQLGHEIKAVTEYVRVFVGEWSLFNSYAVGVDTQGGINPTQKEFTQSTKLTKSELEEVYSQLWQKSIDAWNVGDGYMYWTYKLNIDTINEPAWYGWDCWDVSRAIAKNWADAHYE